MGYYVTLQDSDFLIPAQFEQEALQALKDLNKRDELKTGGSWEGGKQVRRWYAWMPADYDKTVVSTAEVFQLLGFDVTVTDEGTRLVAYNTKTGAENVFIEAVAPFVRDGSYLEWLGEDGERWRHVVRDGKIVAQTAKVTWE